VAQFNDLLLN